MLNIKNIYAAKKTFILLILLFSASIEYTAFAQKMQLVRVVSHNYPQIKVILDFGEQTNVDINALALKKNNKEIEFKSNKVNWIEINEKHIAYLFEYKEDKSTDTIATSVLKSFDFLSEKDFTNLFLYGFKAEKNAVFPLSAEFSNNRSYFKKYFSDIYLNKADSTDLCQTLNETIEFMTQRKKENVSDVLFFIGNARAEFENEKSLSKCIKKAKSEQIKIFAVIFDAFSQKALDNIVRLSIETGGLYSFQNKKNILPEIEKYIRQIRDEIYQTPGNLFEISFEVTDFQLETHNYLIRYNDQELNIPIVHNHDSVETFWSLESTILVVMLTTSILLLLSYFYRSTKKRATNTPEILKGEHIEDHYTEDNKLKPIKIPTLNVVLHEKHEIIEMNRLILNIGRNPENDLVISDATVSGFHAVISNENNKFFITDNNSTNGVFVNNSVVTKTELHDGDTIKLGIAVLQINF